MDFQKLSTKSIIYHLKVETVNTLESVQEMAEG